MKYLKIILVLGFFVCLINNISAQDMSQMMEQYKNMGIDMSKNFPKEWESILPSEYKLENKSFVYQETAKMFLMATLKGGRVNDVYKKFGLNSEIEIGITAYNKQSASYMAEQYKVAVDNAKSGYSEDISNESEGGWEKSPVVISKINNADVYIQKCVRNNVELDDFKHEAQTYYFAQVILVRNNVLLTIKIIYYPLHESKVKNIITHITEKINAIDFDKYME